MKVLLLLLLYIFHVSAIQLSNIDNPDKTLQFFMDDNLITPLGQLNLQKTNDHSSFSISIDEVKMNYIDNLVWEIQCIV